jgi:O-antigen/teichoic acid export membrane protein
VKRIKSGVFLALSGMFSKVFGAFIQLAIVQLIPYQDYSVFVLITRIQALLQVGSDWGVSTAILKNNCNDENEPVKNITVLIILVIVFSLPAFLAIIFYFLFSESLYSSIGNVLNLWGMFFLLIIFLFGASLQKILTNIAVCDELFKCISVSGITISLFFGIVMILSGWAFGVVGIIVTSFFYPWGYVAYFIYKKVSFEEEKSKNSLNYFKGFFKRSWRFSTLCAFSNIASQLQYSIGFFFLVNTREIAIAGLLYSVLNYMRLVPQAAIKVLFKKYFGSESLKMYSVKNNIFSVFLLSIITIGIFSVFYFIYSLLGHNLPDVYHNISSVIFVSGLMFSIWITIVPWAQMNIAEGRVHVNFLIVIVEIFINIYFLIFAVESVTAINMFYSLAISYGVGALLHIIDRILHNRYKLSIAL